MARKRKSKSLVASKHVHVLLNPVGINLDLGNAEISLGSTGSSGRYRRYDKYDAMRDEENRQRWANWWDKKSDGERQLWVGGGFALAGLLLWGVLTAKQSSTQL
jgi:hypothetical protein